MLPFHIVFAFVCLLLQHSFVFLYNLGALVIVLLVLSCPCIRIGKEGNVAVVEHYSHLSNDEYECMYNGCSNLGKINKIYHPDTLPLSSWIRLGL
jgi:hypothetical protein